MRVLWPLGVAPAGGGVKPPHAALAEDCRGERCGKGSGRAVRRGPGALLTDLRRNAPGTLQRLRAYVPRHTATTDGSTAELRDARLIIARELGFPTWR